MTKVCKHCKVETDRDYCRICGSHDLVDMDNRYQRMKITVRGIIYDKSKRMFCIETDDEIIPVTTVGELKNLNIIGINSIIQKLKKMRLIEQREYVSSLFGGRFMDVYVKYDMLFGIITEIESYIAQNIDINFIHKYIVSHHNAIYNDDDDSYTITFGPMSVVVKNIHKKNKKSVYIYVKFSIGDKWIYLYNKNVIGRLVFKNIPMVEQTVIEEIEFISYNGMEIISALIDSAKNQIMSKSDIEYFFDMMQRSGRISGYVVSNIHKNISDKMSRYDFVVILLDAMDYTNGKAVKEFLAKKAGDVLLGKIW